MLGAALWTCALGSFVSGLESLAENTRSECGNRAFELTNFLTG